MLDDACVYFNIEYRGFILKIYPSGMILNAKNGGFRTTNKTNFKRKLTSIFSLLDQYIYCASILGFSEPVAPVSFAKGNEREYYTSMAHEKYDISLLNKKAFTDADINFYTNDSVSLDFYIIPNISDFSKIGFDYMEYACGKISNRNYPNSVMGVLQESLINIIMKRPQHFGLKRCSHIVFNPSKNMLDQAVIAATDQVNHTKHLFAFFNDEMTALMACASTD
jgi:hypothetical protein